MSHPDRGSLKQRALRAGSWTALGFGLSQGLRLVSTLVMTRILAPEMFGVMTIATMVGVIIALLTDLGIKQNIIQSAQGNQTEFLNTAWTLQVLRGFALWAVAILASLALHLAGSRGLLPPDTVYGAPVLPWLIAATGFNAVITGLQSTNMAVAERRLEQRQLMLMELMSQATAIACMVAVGMATRSVWALVVGGWASALVTVVLSHVWLPGPRNRLGWDERSLKEIVSFGKWVFVSSFIGVFALNADRIVLGGLVPAGVLGQYAIASTIVGAMHGIFTKLYGTVAMPAMSETVRADRQALRTVFYRLRTPSDVALFLSAGLLAGCGSLLIDLLYDHRYQDAGWMVQILAFSLLWTRHSASQLLYLALALPKQVAIINATRFVAVFLALPAGYYLGGMKGALWGLSLHQAVIAILVFRFNSVLRINDFRREFGVLLALPVGYALGFSLQRLLR
jgi:O-antigen/teichoic acid export membrane protein